MIQESTRLIVADNSGAKVVVRRFVVGPRCGAVAQQVHSDDLPAFITQQVDPAVGDPGEVEGGAKTMNLSLIHI